MQVNVLQKVVQCSINANSYIARLWYLNRTFMSNQQHLVFTNTSVRDRESELELLTSPLEGIKSRNEVEGTCEFSHVCFVNFAFVIVGFLN